ncbi:MAG: hypothetical protein ACPG3X_07185 [Opitutales bacterium]
MLNRLHFAAVRRVGALLLACSIPGCAVLAYHQGSYFLFDIRASEAPPRASERIPIAPDTFDTAESRETDAMATMPLRSEFEVDFSTLGTNEGSVSLSGEYKFGSPEAQPSGTGMDAFGLGVLESEGFDFTH